ncbi:MAG TPA: hypothetical protein VE449_10030 [Thermoleophilaceae bacterium]|nr:hypothetical protein [Thermoleophilaceae bacterium]
MRDAGAVVHGAPREERDDPRLHDGGGAMPGEEVLDRLRSLRKQPAFLLPGELPRDGHLGKARQDHADEHERRTRRRSEQKPGRAGEDRPSDEEIDRDKERNEQHRRKRPEIVTEVPGLL